MIEKLSYYKVKVDGKLILQHNDGCKILRDEIGW